MLAFVIPFKPKRNSKDWSLDSSYLRRTIQSMLCQTDPSFRIYVLIHDMPDDPLFDLKIEYVNFPLPYATFSEIIDGMHGLRSNSYYGERDIEYLFDQGRKQMYGAHIAQKVEADYVMCVDADDLVHKDLVKFVHDCHQADFPGWFVNKGYFLLAGENLYIRQPASMNMLNGSTYIIHQNFLPTFDLNDLRVSACDFFANHPYLQQRILQLFGKHLMPLPFYATVVQITEQNWWKSTAKIKGVNLRQKIKYLIRRVYFNKSFLRDFGLN